MISCEVGLSGVALASGRRTPDARTEPSLAPIGNLAHPGAGGWVTGRPGQGALGAQRSATQLYQYHVRVLPHPFEHEPPAVGRDVEAAE